GTGQWRRIQSPRVYNRFPEPRPGCLWSDQTVMTELSALPRMLVLVGPTAVGKTKLSLLLGQQYECEIISGDSMQVYRGMDIGTAKASPEERRLVPHHLIDIRDPDEGYSVSDFQEQARACAAQIHARGK